MAKKSERPLRKHTMNFYDGDLEELRDILGAKVDTGKVIRELVHDLVKKLKSRDPTVPKLNIEVKP